MSFGAAKEVFWLTESWVQLRDPRLPSLGQGLELGPGEEQAVRSTHFHLAA